MKAFLRRWSIEVGILFLGSVASLVELLIVENQEIGIVLLVMTILVTAATLAIKNEIADQLGSDPLRMLVNEIEDDQWRNDARRRVARLEMDVREWTDGVRTLGREESIPYQISLIKDRTSESIQAIHLALPSSKLSIWSKQTGAFSRLAQAHRELTKIERMRILVLNGEEEGLVEETAEGRRFTNALVDNFCRDQMAQATGFGVDLRIFFLSEVGRVGGKPPPDLLVVDKREAIIVSNIVEAAGNESFTTQAIVNDLRLDDYCQLFDSIWQIADPASDYFPPGTFTPIAT